MLDLAAERSESAVLESGEPVAFTASHYRGDAYDFVAELSIGPGET